MKKEVEIALLTAVIVLLVASAVFLYKPSPQNPIKMNNTINQSNLTQNKTLIILNGTNIKQNSNSTVSISELSMHNLKENCWVSYKDKVYDITSWLPRHPGSAEAIIPYCGNSTKFEQAFEGQHGTSQVQRLIEEGIYKGDLVLDNLTQR